jgi:hypothetical protein
LNDAKDTVMCISEEIESHKRAYERRGKDRKRKDESDAEKVDIIEKSAEKKKR